MYGAANLFNYDLSGSRLAEELWLSSKGFEEFLKTLFSLVH